MLYQISLIAYMTRGVRGPKSTVPLSANFVGSVAAERLYRAFGAPVPNYSVLGGECSLSVLGLMLVPMFFSFLLIVPISLLSGPFVSSRIPCFVPKREVSEVLSFREPKRLWLYCPKLGLL